MQGQGCRQTSTHRPEQGEAFLPVLKGPSVPQTSLTSLEAGWKPQHCADALVRRASRGGVGCLTSLAGSVPLEEMDLVQTKGIW